MSARSRVEVGQPLDPHQCREADTYVDQMLKGAKPAELPVQLPTKLELVIALKTAKSIGQTVAEGLVARAVSNSRCAEILLRVRTVSDGLCVPR
jgi:hypothetical protein